MACPAYINGISGACDSSLGGVTKVLIGKYVENAFATSATTDGLVNVVTGISSAVTELYAYEFKKNTGSLTSTLNIDNANGVNYVSTELVLQFAKRDTAKRLEMAALATGDLIALVKDANNVWTALGISEPVNATAGTGQTGTNKSDGNFYQITLADDYSTFPLHLSDEAVAAALALVANE